MVNTAVVGTSVTVLFAGDSEAQTYRLVAQHETHDQDAVSVGSPLGLAVLGANVGEVVRVVAPAGDLKVTILDIAS
jgi:transcription elongation GreA/GreB family factor